MENIIALVSGYLLSTLMISIIEKRKSSIKLKDWKRLKIGSLLKRKNSSVYREVLNYHEKSLTVTFRKINKSYGSGTTVYGYQDLRYSYEIVKY